MYRQIRQMPVFAFLRSLDYLQIAAMILLLGIGLTFIHSTGLQIDTDESRVFFGKQLMWIAAGSAVYIFVSILDLRSLPCRIAVSMGYAVSLILLTVVLFAGLKIYGATRWLEIGGFRLQPSEPAKLMMACMLAIIFSSPQLAGNKFLCFFTAAFIVGIPFILIAVEPDLGSALILLPVAAAIIFCSGIKWRYVILGLAAVAAGIAFIIFDSMREEPVLLRNYQRDRIKVFLNPGMDKGNRGHNAFQAKLAVGAGGRFGTGIGKGTQNELGFLPHTVSNNDFIFSVIAEETGFCGAAVLLLLYGLLLYSILRTAFLISGYGRYLAIGIATLVFCHVYINIGMCIGIAPVTGLPLPLISYGGSFTITSMTTLAVVQSLYRHQKCENDE